MVTCSTSYSGEPNSHNKWRTARGKWFSADVIAETWENPECEEGWYETSVECEDDVNCWATNPTHWQPLPPAPGASLPPPARNGEMSDEEIIQLCKSAGITWHEPDPEDSGFPGLFDMVSMSEMRALLSASCAPKQTEGDGNG